MRNVISCVAAVLMPLTTATAQQSEPAPFAMPPSAGTVCHVLHVPPPRSDSVGSLMYTFMRGNRTLSASYDSTGTPRVLSDARVYRDSGERVDMRTVVFQRTGEFGMRYVLRQNERPDPSKRPEDLPPNDMNQARILADWLWRQRCGAGDKH